MHSARLLNPFALIAILAVPLLFVWLLLLPGTAKSTRVAGLSTSLRTGFVFAVGMILPGLVVVIVEAMGG